MNLCNDNQTHFQSQLDDLRITDAISWKVVVPRDVRAHVICPNRRIVYLARLQDSNLPRIALSIQNLKQAFVEKLEVFGFGSKKEGTDNLMRFILNRINVIVHGHGRM